YVDNQLKILKRFDDHGNVYEHNYFYNADGKLKFRIFKNPDLWKQKSEKTWSDGVQDSTFTIYKDIVNLYDEENRLVRHQKFKLSDTEEDYGTPYLFHDAEYKYENDNLIYTKKIYATGLEILISINTMKLIKFQNCSVVMKIVHKLQPLKNLIIKTGRF